MQNNISIILMFIGISLIIVACIIHNNNNRSPYRTINQRVEILEVQMDLVISEIGRLNKEKK